MLAERKACCATVDSRDFPQGEGSSSFPRSKGGGRRFWPRLGSIDTHRKTEWAVIGDLTRVHFEDDVFPLDARLPKRHSRGGLNRRGSCRRASPPV